MSKKPKIILNNKKKNECGITACEQIKMPRCVIVGCNNNGNHSFPKDSQLRKQWEKSTEILNFTASKNSRICSQHFKETDYYEISDATGLPQVHRYLKKTAVPSVFSWKKATATTTGGASKKRFKQYCPTKEPSTSQQVSVDATPDIPETAGHRVYVFCSEHLPEDPEHELKIEETTDDLFSTTSQKTVSTQTPSLFRLFSSGEDMLSDARSVLYQARLENMRKFNLYLIEEFK